MSQRRRAVGLAGLALLLWSGEAAAKRDPDLPRPDPKGPLRIAAYEDAESTSPCIGHSPTPMCAVDNYFLCMLRRDERTCYAALRGTAGQDDPDERSRHFTNPNDSEYYMARVPVKLRQTFKYRVVIAGRVRDLTIWRNTFRQQGYFPDDVVIVVKQYACFVDRVTFRCLDDVGDYHAHFLRKIDGEWRNLAWGTDPTRPWQAINMVLQDQRMDETDRMNYLQSLNNPPQPTDPHQ